METLQISPQSSLMNSISAHFRTKISLNYSSLRPFCASCIDLRDTHELFHGGSRKKRGLRDSCGVRVKVSNTQLKENWLESLSCPVPDKIEEWGVEGGREDGGVEWMLGVDPDVSGALAVLKSDELGCSAQVFDSPHLQVLVGKKVRRRLDAKSIVQLLRSLDAPLGTTAYIEQSIPFPQDGKQGWWGGGFGYGMWIGILVASGFSVVPVPSNLWKNHFKLPGNRLSKDDSREVAGTLFPSLSSLLKRKKDHGRAEALLIAAYGKGLQMKPDSCASEMLLTSENGVADASLQIKLDSCTTEMLLTSENGVEDANLHTRLDSCSTEMLLTSKNEVADAGLQIKPDSCSTEMLLTSENGYADLGLN